MNDAMNTNNDHEEVRTAWQMQTAEINAAEVRRTIQEMERRMRRERIDFFLAIALSSIVLVGIAVLFANPLLICGALATVGGLVFLAYEMRRHDRRAPAAENGGTVSVDYHRALLRHRLEFHRKGLWSRVLALAPGGVLFFLGFAAARPDLALLIYFQLASFVIAVFLIVPLNQRAAAKLKQQIAELDGNR